MGDPHFGIVIRRIDREPRPVYGADLSTIGLIGPAETADPALFPLNEPVLIYSNDTETTKRIGDGGYIRDAIESINAQLGETQFAARIVFVRTAEGADPNVAIKNQQTIANIVGSSVQGTGVYAFLKSPDKLGVVPRLMIAPGYTGQMANNVDEVTVTTPGAGYTPGATVPLTFAGGGTNPTIIQATGHAIAKLDGTIAQEDIYLDTRGAWYTAAPTVTAPAPGGGGTQMVMTADISAGANPLVANMEPVLNQLLAHAVVESAGVSEQGDIDWRETINSQRIIPVVGGVKKFSEAGVIVRPFAPCVVGVAVRRDHEKGAPFHSWANQPIHGIIGPGRDMSFALTDDANEAQRLLGANIGVLIRGEVGNDFAIASGGFVFIGTDVATDDTLWQFYNVTRGRDYIHLGMLRALRTYLGRFNINGHTVQAILNTMRFFLRDLKADDHILGSAVGFNPDSNSPEQIRLGHLTVSFAAEEPPVLRKITTESSRYRPAIEAMVAQLEAQLALNVTA